MPEEGYAMETRYQVGFERVIFELDQGRYFEASNIIELIRVNIGFSEHRANKTLLGILKQRTIRIEIRIPQRCIIL